METNVSVKRHLGDANKHIFLPVTKKKKRKRKKEKDEDKKKKREKKKSCEIF